MNESIIAQRPRLGRLSENDLKKKEEIRKLVRARYASAYAKASFWGKLKLHMEMAYEIKLETQRLDPGIDYNG